MRIGARGSDLAQWQARWVAERLQTVGIACEQVVVQTLGDRITDRPLNQVGAQGVFTKELEDALLRGDIDLAVHSYKDLALAQPEGLMVAAVSERDDPADLLIVREDRVDERAEPLPLPAGAVVGTSAVRRGAQLTAMQPEITLRDLRGNVPTRLRKLAAGGYDAIFLAAAGVRRLGLDLADFRVLRLEPESFVPSPAQGALAVEMCGDHPQADVVRSTVDHEETALAVAAERGVLAAFGGGCSLPLGAFIKREGADWRLTAFWDDPTYGPCWGVEAGRDALALVGQLVPRLRKGDAQ